MSDLIRTILVPCDFSSFSEAAAQTAADFARKLQAKLILLHVVDVADYGSFKMYEDDHEISLKVIAENTAGERFEQLKQSSNFKGIKLQDRCLQGHRL